MSKKSLKIMQLMALTSVLFFYQNCAKPFETEFSSDLASLGGANSPDAESIEIFSRTLHPTLRANCVACHGVSQVPKFAVANPASAFATIKEFDLVNLNTPSQSYFVEKITNGHNGFSAAMAQTIQKNIEDWAAELGDVTNPIVNMTLPANGTTVSGSINLTATATDNIGVTGVQFYVDNKVYGALLTAAPYTLAFDTLTLPNGMYTFAVRAFDEAGNYGESIVSATINNLAVDVQNPVVALTAPAPNSSLTGIANITASAADNVGVQRVEFYIGAQMIGLADTAAPYSASLDTKTITNGAHVLTARAYDAAGNMAVSANLNVTINNDLQAPAVTLTAPLAGSTLSGMVNLAATATDNVAVQRVEFYIGAQIIGLADTTAPYGVGFNTASVANGAHVFSVRAYDAAGNMGVSANVSVTVNNVAPDVQAPTVAITAPAANATLTGTVNVAASASDNSAVQRVEFFIGNQMIGTADTTAPYAASLNTTTIANGSHVLMARAYDMAGNMGVSANVSVTVNNVAPDIQAPTVAITAPAAASTVSGVINITANASDNVGVERVQFYLDGVMLGAADTTPPYSISTDTKLLTNASHVVSARAYDIAGNMTASANITFTVNNVVVNPNATFTWISTNVLVPRCTSCHGAARADSGIRYNTYAETIKTVRAGNPTGSNFYKEVAPGGSMPKGGSRLTADQVKAINDWIAAGALNN